MTRGADEPHYWAFEAEDGDGSSEPLHGQTFALSPHHSSLHDSVDAGDSSDDSDSDSSDASEPPPPPSQYANAGSRPPDQELPDADAHGPGGLLIDLDAEAVGGFVESQSSPGRSIGTDAASATAPDRTSPAPAGAGSLISPLSGGSPSAEAATPDISNASAKGLASGGGDTPDQTSTAPAKRESTPMSCEERSGDAISQSREDEAKSGGAFGGSMANLPVAIGRSMEEHGDSREDRHEGAACAAQSSLIEPGNESQTAVTDTGGDPAAEGVPCAASDSFDSEDYDDSSTEFSSEGEQDGVTEDTVKDETNGCLEAGFFALASIYSRKCPGRCPCCCMCIWVLAVLACVGSGMVLMPIDIETDFSAFMKTDVLTSVQRDGFLAALKMRSEEERRLSEQTHMGQRRLLEGFILYVIFDLAVAYEVHSDAQQKSVFHLDHLERIADFESRLRKVPMWQELCGETDEIDRSLCDPGLSVINYARPAMQLVNSSIVPNRLTLNSSGTLWAPIESSFKLMDAQNMKELFLPEGFQTESAKLTSSVRSVFRFRLPCCSPMDDRKYQTEKVRSLRAKWKMLVENSLLPLLSNPEPEGHSDADESEPWPLKVFYTGNNFEGIEVMQALMADSLLAAGSFGFVLVYLVLHTKSFMLSCVGLFIIGLSVPFSYVFFALLAQSTKMSVASFLSLFLVVGLGSDVIFVYTDFWRDSEGKKKNEADRLEWTYQHAGKASFATTFTTALSFFANLVSVLKPLREFGMFMGLCVVFVWMIISGVYVPLLLLDDRCCRRCRITNLCCLGTRSSPQATGDTKRFGFGPFAEKVHRWRRLCLILTGLTVIASFFGFISTVGVDTGVPSIFPKDHNQNRGKEVLKRFPSLMVVFPDLVEAPGIDVLVCNEWGADPANEQCKLQWCEANVAMKVPDANQCFCFRKMSESTCGRNSQFQVVLRIVGVDLADEATLREEVVKRFVHLTNVQVDEGQAAVLSRRLQPMLIQEWESGTADLQPVLQFNVKMSGGEAGPCGWEEACYCGTHPCKLPESYDFAGEFRVAALRRALQGSAARQWNVDPAVRADVSVVWGLKIDTRKMLFGERDLEEAWDFDPLFLLRKPWAQRNLYVFCKNLSEDLEVATKRCWVQEFRDYLVSMGARFPVLEDEFDTVVMQWLQFGFVGLHPPVAARDFVWTRRGEANQEIKATNFYFKIDVHKNAETSGALRHQERWDNLLREYNTQASEYARGAFHTSGLWVRAEAQAQLQSSTAMTLAIVILLAFVGMYVFTRDCMLAVYVVLATLMVLIGLAFFITGIMGWAIGPIEVIALIVFIGYAVTYSLHIAHKYGASEALREVLPPSMAESSDAAAVRFKRASFALKSIGSAALGSAMTTAGCSMFLLFCTMTIFQKLGGVVLAVTVMSIVVALGPLPAALFVLGPVAPGKFCFGCKTAPGMQFGSRGGLAKFSLPPPEEPSASENGLPQDEM